MMHYTDTTLPYLRKRKMLLVLPVLLLPFITLGFWALGGGKLTYSSDKDTPPGVGLNLRLPDAHLKKDAGLDKMSYYELAMVDSDKLKARIKNDPFFKLSPNLEEDSSTITGKGATQNSNNETTDVDGRSDIFKNNKLSVNEKKVYARLNQINEVLSGHAFGQESSKTPGLSSTLQGVEQENTYPIRNDNTKRIESMMHAMKQESSSDSEMNQINAMLEKVMDIQHPERLNEKYRQSEGYEKKNILNVSGKNVSNEGFYDADTIYSNGNSYSPGSFDAVVSDKQTLVTGAVVKLRLMTDVCINGTLIPKNNFVFGKAALNGERLSVSISGIQYRGALLPVALVVYDIDGLEGIYVPGAITREVVKQSTDNALQSVALNSLDPSIGMQAAGAGIETAKTLISKKVKVVRVTVNAGYHVLLKNNDLR